VGGAVGAPEAGGVVVELAGAADCVTVGTEGDTARAGRSPSAAGSASEGAGGADDGDAVGAGLDSRLQV
jgi:hypothetical protein